MNAERTPAPEATLSIRRTVKSGRELEYEADLAAVLSTAAKSDGWLGASVAAVGREPAEYDIRMHFVDQTALDAWTKSELRRDWLHRQEELSVATKVQQLNAQDAWLVPAQRLHERPPPRYKVALLTWLGIYPLITLILAFVGPHIAKQPVGVRSLILTATAIPLMTWVVMPVITKVTGRWLHAQARART